MIPLCVLRKTHLQDHIGKLYEPCETKSGFVVECFLFCEAMVLLKQNIILHRTSIPFLLERNALTSNTLAACATIFLCVYNYL